MAHRIVIMNGGSIEQIGTPDQVYDAPRTRFVAGFMGRCNFVDVERTEAGRIAVLPGGIPIEAANEASTSRVVAIRPHNLVLSEHPGHNCLTGRLVKSLYLGPVTHLTLDVGRFSLLVDAPSEAARLVRVGDRVTVCVEPKNARLLVDADSSSHVG